MKIVVFSNCPLVESQGSGYVIANYARGLRERGHSVQVWGPDACELFKFLRKGRAYRLAVGIAARALWQVLRNDHDVVEMYGGECWLAAVILKRLPARRFLLVQHSNGLETFASERAVKYIGSDTLDGRPRKWYQRLLNVPVRRAFTDVDGLVTVSKVEVEYALSKRYQEPARIVGIDNALPDNFLGLPLDLVREKRVIYCGSWLVKKGCRTITKDMAQILEEFPEWRFRMVGVGVDFDKRDHFPVGICDRIEVIPFVTDKSELHDLYATSAISITPSVYESFGLVVAEAMACGCATVTANTGFAAGLIDRKDLLLMQSPLSPNLYICVRDLILDDSLRESAASAGYRSVQHLKWRTSIDTLEQTYSKWLQELRAGKG